MNDQIPMWWLAISGLAFAMNLVLFVVMSYVLVQVLPILKMLPGEIRRLSQKVDEVSDHVEHIAQDVRATTATVRDRTGSILGGVESFVGGTAKHLEKATPIIAGIFTAIKILRSVNELRQAHKEAAVRKAQVENERKALELKKEEVRLAKVAKSKRS